MSGLAGRDHINREIMTLTHAALMRRAIRLTCPLCKRSRVLDAVPLWWKWSRKGWDDYLPKVVRRLYCQQCWCRRFSSVRPIWKVSDEAPTGPQGAYPPESEWKRFTSRYRS